MKIELVFEQPGSGVINPLLVYPGGTDITNQVLLAGKGSLLFAFHLPLTPTHMAMQVQSFSKPISSISDLGDAGVLVVSGDQLYVSSHKTESLPNFLFQSRTADQVHQLLGQPGRESEFYLVGYTCHTYDQFMAVPDQETGKILLIAPNVVECIHLENHHAILDSNCHLTLSENSKVLAATRVSPTKILMATSQGFQVLECLTSEVSRNSDFVDRFNSASQARIWPTPEKVYITLLHNSDERKNLNQISLWGYDPNLDSTARFEFLGVWENTGISLFEQLSPSRWVAICHNQIYIIERDQNGLRCIESERFVDAASLTGSPECIFVGTNTGYIYKITLA